jgi:hypothetical protein
MGCDREIPSYSKEDILRFVAKCKNAIFRRNGISLVICVIVFVVGMNIMCFQKKVSESTAIIQILHESPNALCYKELTKNEVKDFEDLNTQLNMFDVKALLVAIINSMSPEEKQNLLSPYFKNWAELSDVEIHKFITKRRYVNLLRKSYTVDISFKHCLPETSALMANKFADFFCDFSMRIERDVVL